MNLSSYIDWSDNIVNSAIKDLTITKKLTATPEQGSQVNLSFAHIVIRVKRYSTLVGQHLVVKSVVLWQKKINGDYYETI